MKLCRMGIVAGCVLAVTLGLLVYPSPTLGFDIQIDVAPNVLNIQSEGVVVTVHTDIRQPSQLDHRRLQHRGRVDCISQRGPNQPLEGRCPG